MPSNDSHEDMPDNARTYVTACSGNGGKRLIRLVATGGLEPPTSAL